MISGLLEIEIMNAMWSMQDQNEDRNIAVADVVEYLDNAAVERAYTTIKTVMDRLSTKDLLVRYRSGKKFFYRSTFDRDEVARATLNDVASQFFKGSKIEMLRFIEKECEHHLA